MFADVDADVYVMADGDLTYDPAPRRWSDAGRRAVRHGGRLLPCKHKPRRPIAADMCWE
jgi:hypothetical protein